MSVVILHLSDIHVRSMNDEIIGKHTLIANTLNPYITGASHVFVVVSGDIAQSGQQVEYDASFNFLTRLKGAIHLLKQGLQAEFILVPGNHDCEFSGDGIVRDLVLKEIPNQLKKLPNALIEQATSVQSNYFEFRKKLLNESSLIHDERLWAIQEYRIEGKSIWFDCINASWMSSKTEKPGTIVFPISQFKEFKNSDADLRIGVAHHPANWLGQDSYTEYRGFVHALEDILFTGHEHVGNAGLRSEALNGECAYIEGCALQTSENGKSEFNVVQIDLMDQKFSAEKFQWDGGRYIGSGSDNWLPIRAMPRKAEPELQISEAFLKVIKDPGATLHHPDKPNLTLDDFYTFPDLDSPGSEKRRTKVIASNIAKKKNAYSLTNINNLDSNVLLEGDDSAGKTRLLYQLYSSYHQQNFLPLFIDAKKMRSSTEVELNRLFNAAIIDQYGQKNLVAYQQMGADRKILLVDDFDKCPLNEEYRERFYQYISVGFRNRIITVGIDFEINELFSSEKISSLGVYNRFRISPFGYERRGELVRKWNKLGATEVASTNGWLQACDQAERLIEGTRLRHVASTAPILVLSLLQAHTSGISKEMQNSSFAHYFHYLIVGALSGVGVSANGFARYIAFGTHLSWYVKKTGIDLAITDAQYREFCEEYSRGWTTTNADDMAEILVRSRILEREEGSFRFTYQYAYYYFLGLYASRFIANDDVKEYLRYCMDNLYVRECANTLLFLSHHSNDVYVLDGVVASLNKHFSRATPATFYKEDIREITALISAAPKLVYKAEDPVKKRVEMDRYRDENDNGDDGLADQPGEERDLLQEIISLSKTIEIAGVLLTNHFATLSREKKNAAIKNIFESALKVIRDFYAIFIEHPNLLVNELTERFETKGGLSKDEAEKEARHAIAWLIRIISTSWISKAGEYVSSADLRDNVNDVVHENPTLAIRLIQIGQLLDGPGRLPIAMMNRLIKGEEDNPCVMSVLQLMVLHRLYMYETHHEDKHWAISAFELAQSAADRVEFLGQGARSENQQKRLT